MDIKNFDLSTIYTRADGSYVINRGLYHVPHEGEWSALWVEVDAYAKAHPEVVQAEPTPPPPSLDDLKTAKRAEVTAWRDAAIAQGTEWSGHTVDTDSDAQRMVTALMVKMQTYKAIGREWTPAPWRLKDGTYITLTEDQATGLALAVSDYVSSCYAREAELVAAVDTAETREELDALSW